MSDSEAVGVCGGAERNAAEGAISMPVAPQRTAWRIGSELVEI